MHKGAHTPDATCRRTQLGSHYCLTSALPVVQADIALLRQVLWWLLGNAVKFSSTHVQIMITVDVYSGVESGHVTLQMQGNRLGLDPGLTTKLFQSFQRLPNAKLFNGLGMGLAVSKKIMQRLSERVALNTSENSGCYAFFFLKEVHS
jgi:light-regulated signal transduction histidine kinase (bacteriophytochrome)